MNWPNVALGKVADILGGSTPRREEPRNWGSGYFWATPTDLPMPGDGILDLNSTAETITEEGLRSCSTNLLPIGTVLFSTRATIGKLAIANVPVATNQGFNNLIAGPVANNRYLAYALQYFTPDISRLAGSTTFKEVSRSSLRGFKIPLPPISEQRRIVEILEEADRLRRLSREASAKAERVLPALFLKMFGDPLTNPYGFPLASIGEFTRLVTSGSTPRGGAEVYVESGPLLIRSQNVLMNRLRLFDAAHITPEMHQQMSRTFVFVGDVLLNITGASIGRVSWVKSLDCEANVNQHVCIIRPDTDKVDSAFLSACLSLPSMQAHINGVQIGASRQALNHVQVRNMTLPLPPFPLQREFARKVDQLDLLLTRSESANDEIERIWSTVLRRAFSGQLTAKWREAHMQELVAEMAVQARQLNLPMPQEAAV